MLDNKIDKNNSWYITLVDKLIPETLGYEFILHLFLNNKLPMHILPYIKRYDINQLSKDIVSRDPSKPTLEEIIDINQ